MPQRVRDLPDANPASPTMDDWDAVLSVPVPSAAGASDLADRLFQAVKIVWVHPMATGGAASQRFLCLSWSSEAPRCSRREFLQNGLSVRRADPLQHFELLEPSATASGPPGSIPGVATGGSNRRHTSNDGFDCWAILRSSSMSLPRSANCSSALFLRLVGIGIQIGQQSLQSGSINRGPASVPGRSNQRQPSPTPPTGKSPRTLSPHRCQPGPARACGHPLR